MLLLSGCGDATSTEALSPTEPSFARAAPSVPLAITVDDLGPTGSYHVRSDGGGEYVNGMQTVIAEIDGYGSLQFRVLITTSPARTLTFDFNAPIDPANAFRPPTTGAQNFTIKSNAYTTGAPSIAELGINGNPSSACYYITLAYSTATTRHGMHFNTIKDPGSTYAYITRTSVSPAVWTMVTDAASCGSTPNAASLYTEAISKKPQPLVFRGYYDLRLSITLRGI
jgi:hypothetical protein